MPHTARKLIGSDWQKYKEIRLEALQDEPSAFGRSYNEESVKSDDYWQTRVSESEKEDGTRFYYGVFNNDSLVSVGGSYHDEDGRWYIVAVYTKAEYRKHGLAKQVITGLLEEFKKRNIEKVYLSVNTKNETAVSLYKKMGFEITKTLKDELMGDGLRHDEYEMVKEL